MLDQNRFLKHFRFDDGLFSFEIGLAFSGLLLLLLNLLFKLLMLVLVVGWNNLLDALLVDIYYLKVWLGLLLLRYRFEVYDFSTLLLGPPFADQDRYVLLGF